MNELNFAVTNGCSQDFVVREGTALPLKEPLQVAIKGILSSPLDWLVKRIDIIDQKQAHLIVDREKLSVTLKLAETDFYQSIISGSLSLHEKFIKFGINTGKFLTPLEMSDLIKMNRSCFENIDTAMNLVSTLRGFKAKVEKQIESSDDKRGNVNDIRIQAVDSNLPKSFNLNIPIFKGMGNAIFEVEVEIRSSDLTCTLISPVANDLIDSFRDIQIDKVLEGIKEIAPDIAIIEV